MIYEKCRDILLQECELIQNAVLIQEKIRAAVTSREWTDFDVHLNAMNSIENKMTVLENERENLFLVYQSLIHERGFCDNLDDKGRFMELVSLLPKKQSEELTEIYRSLKIESIKLHMSNDALMTYITGVKSTLQEFFDLAFPERGGKMYTKDGTHFSNDMRSMVLNRSF
ncbi:MAG: hypothetical protein FWB86_14225 [Treponema sp.]|nr:hypothetical protein [Treponema sp.]